MRAKGKKESRIAIGMILLMLCMSFYPLCANASDMTISETGLNLIKSFEGCRLTAYKAVSTETYYTIGWGHYGPDVYEGMTITQAEADALLVSDLQKYVGYVNTFLNKYSITVNQSQFDALVSFTYNLGNVWVSEPTFQLKTYLINGVSNYTEQQIRTAFTNWNKSGGVVLEGLTRRRNAEADLFLSSSASCDCNESYAGNYIIATESLPLNMRSGHGSSYSLVTTIPKDTQVYVSKGNGSWAHVEYNGYSGYCSMEYLERVSTGKPTNPRISANQVWYDLEDTIEITAYADGATRYYMSMFKDEERIKGESVSGGKFTMSASDYGKGEYSVYFSCSNDAGTVDTSWITFSVVGAAGYSSVWTSAPIYDLDDTVSISVSPVCSDGQWLGIDKNGVGRVITQQTETTYTIAASQLGVGSYSAYFTVYNGSGGIDTERVEFVIAEPSNLGDQFYARIRNTSTDMYITNVNGNVEGEPLDCDRSRTWRFDRQSDGTYKIISSLDNGAMDVTDYGNAGNSTNIQMNTSWDTTAQKFYIYEAYGAYYFKAICCDLYLDMDQNAPNNLAVWGGGADWPAQKFEIIKVHSDDVGVHKYVPEVTKEATCTEEGTRTHTCSVCQDLYTETIELTSHQYSDDWTIDAEATYASEGSKSRHCLNCDAKTDVTVIPKLEESTSNPFEDVYEWHFFYNPVLWAYNDGIANGKSSTLFAPYDISTRGDVVTFLWRAAGSPEPSSTVCPFVDVPEYAYYYKAILWAVESGITNGTSATTFEPNAQCTRAQVVTFLWRVAGSEEPESAASTFGDVPDYAYYLKAVLWAVENGITNGTSSTTFAPDAACTRGEIVTFLYRHYN